VPSNNALFKAERTTALYSLLQHSTQVQIRIFTTNATNRQSSAFDLMSSFLSPVSASNVGNPIYRDTAAILAQRAK